MSLQRVFRDGCGKWTSLSFVVLLCVSATRAQGPAPETAPPLFPGGGLVSYNSIFTTRGLMQQSAGNIPATARPTFAHEGDFNFTWGFYRNFDLTILVPLVTNLSLKRQTHQPLEERDWVMPCCSQSTVFIGEIHDEGQRRHPSPSAPRFQQVGQT